MTIRLAFVVLALVLPNNGAAQNLPDAARAIIEQSDLAEPAKAALAAQWPAADLADVITSWSQEQRRAVSDHARAALIADTLVEEHRVSAQFSPKPEDARQSSKRALRSFLDEDLDDASAMSVGTYMERDFGQYSEPVKTDNYLGTIHFDSQTSGSATSSAGDSVEFEDVVSVTLMTGAYELSVEKGGQTCTIALSVPAGRSAAPSCP